jgi:hypothetical protein
MLYQHDYSILVELCENLVVKLQVTTQQTDIEVFARLVL